MSDTFELVIALANPDTSLIIVRNFKPSSFCMEQIYINSQLMLRNKMEWSNKERLYYGGTETIFVNDIPVLETLRFNNTCDITSRDILYRNFTINDTIQLETGYCDNGNIESCILFFHSRKFFGYQFDSTNLKYSAGFYGEDKVISTSPLTTKENPKRGIWYTYDFDANKIDSFDYE